ncbi:DUF6544 family protein [Catellatospora chokoriensis]|uniref:Uncharacterized protein n=1 Tax=Catellatospora chokoriensis TaxID=310353 RepID=A0A8J3KC13_9ACTN|nr:DUF6544 family protein [Catellatospora chokoriensis]GIF93993.1 hypothetical protein Cch02nite_74370 [Catellatospora chokoriensis]
MNTAARPRHHPSAQPASIDPSLRAQWSALTAPTDPATEFTADMTADLPAPTRRWLNRAIAPGTPLRRAAIVRQHGQIRIGGWHDYEADWALSPLNGFIWSATTHLGPIAISGYDRYTRGSGEMRWRLFGLLPLMTASGADVTRSAAGRLAAEFCFVPATALASQVRWSEVDHSKATATIDLAGISHPVTITVATDGTLTRVDVPRWGQPTAADYAEHLFTALLDGPEATYDGFTIRSAARAGWWQCPDHCATEEFIRFAIDHVDYR